LIITAVVVNRIDSVGLIITAVVVNRIDSVGLIITAVVVNRDCWVDHHSSRG